MQAAAHSELLYPLTLFRSGTGEPLPEFEVVSPEAIPEPQRTLLVHTGDMTSRLAAFHQGEIALEVLHREQEGSVQRREVVLRVRETALPVEYGAIEIVLDSFAPELQRQVLEGKLPLGGLLNASGTEYRSRPKAYIRLGADPLMQRIFGAPAVQEFFGRCNELLDARGVVFARIVEVLRPA